MLFVAAPVFVVVFAVVVVVGVFVVDVVIVAVVVVVGVVVVDPFDVERKTWDSTSERPLSPSWVATIHRNVVKY